MVEVYIWRLATQLEIDKGLDSPDNRGMVLEDIEILDDTTNEPKGEKPGIKDILSATPEEILLLKEKLGIP